MRNRDTIDQINSKIKELKARADKLKAKPGTLVFKPKYGEYYEHVDGYGKVDTNRWSDHPADLERLKIGNVFRVGTAKNSAKYYYMNSPYDYWLPWSGRQLKEQGDEV